MGGWPSIDAHLAARAAGTSDEEAARMLTEAAEVELLDPAADDRYRLRPEVRRYLAETAASEHGVPACSAAVERVLDDLLNRALYAAHAALPQSWRTEPAPGRRRTRARHGAWRCWRRRRAIWSGRCPWPRSTGTPPSRCGWPVPCGPFS
ncbi:hypothetical protein NKH77_19100 [Streptomyces sp. M19]